MRKRSGRPSCGGRRFGYRRERVDDARRRFLGFRLARRAGGAADAPLVVLFHGLEGSSTSHYARALMARARRARLARRDSRIFAAAAANPTGCRARITRAITKKSARCSPRFARACSRVPSFTPPAFRSAAARCSTGWAAQGDAAANTLARGGRGVGAARPHRVRPRHRPRLQPHLHVAFPAHAEAEGASHGRHSRRRSTSIACAAPIRMYAFDDAVTAPLHGFADTRRLLDARARPSRGCASIALPTLVLNARTIRSSRRFAARTCAK